MKRYSIYRVAMAPLGYPQLVDHSVFMACEARTRNPQKAIKITRHPFVLRGLLTCAASGRKVTCAKVKGRYIYLIARDPANKDKVVWVKEDAVMEQLKSVLQSFTIPDDLLAEYLDYIKRTHEAEKELHRASVKELRTEDSNLAEKLNRLADLMIEGHIDPKLFDIKNKEITFRRMQIACLLKDNVNADSDFKDALWQLKATIYSRVQKPIKNAACSDSYF